MNYPVDMNTRPEVKAFFDADTNTISYVVRDPDSNVVRNDRFRDGHRLCRRPHHL